MWESNPNISDLEGPRNSHYTNAAMQLFTCQGTHGASVLVANTVPATRLKLVYPTLKGLSISQLWYADLCPFYPGGLTSHVAKTHEAPAWFFTLPLRRVEVKSSDKHQSLHSMTQLF